MEIVKDIENKIKYQGFLRVKIVRKIEEVMNLTKRNRKLIGNINGSLNDYLIDLKEYENSVKREYKSNYKRRYGIIFTLLLPKDKEWTTLELIKIASKFYKYVVGEEKGLRYAAFKETKGKAIYLKVYISDRESYSTSRIKTYKRDLYVNKYTHTICKKTDPNAMLKCRKGDYKLDENGEAMIEHLLFKERKSRRFVYKDNHFEAWVDMFKDYLLQTIMYFKNHINITYGKYFRRMNLRFAYNRFERRIIKANNSLMQYIQNELNSLLKEKTRYPDEIEIYKDLYVPGELMPLKETQNVLKLFEKYRKIFNEGKYFIENDEYFIKKCRCDVAEDNLIKLKAVFKADKQQLIRNWR